jgi:hypothetical protein
MKTLSGLRFDWDRLPLVRLPDETSFRADHGVIAIVMGSLRGMGIGLPRVLVAVLIGMTETGRGLTGGVSPPPLA